MRYKEFKRLAESATVQDNGILEGASSDKEGWQEQRRWT